MLTLSSDQTVIQI